MVSLSVEYVEHVDVWAATHPRQTRATLRTCWLSCGKRAQTCNSSSPGAQNPARE